MPADNNRALSKVNSLSADCIIFDLEDAVAPPDKATARENLREFFSRHTDSKAERAIRINGLSTQWGTEDLMCARACMPDAIVLPKVDRPDDVLALADALDQTDAAAQMEIFAMIETATGLLNIGDIAALGRDTSSRLSCLIVGMNDLIKETRVKSDVTREIVKPWLMQIVLAARSGNLDAIDAVYNDFGDVDGLTAQCRAAADMGFDGKTLIHPAQIEAANFAFSPNETELAEAEEIVNAFRLHENSDKGVIVINGKMVERLHLQQAKALLTRAAAAGLR